MKVQSILVTGGHFELQWDLVRLFRLRMHKQVWVSNISPDSKRPKPSCLSLHPNASEAHENIWRATLEYCKEFGNNAVHLPLYLFGQKEGVPSLADYMHTHCSADIESLVEGVDVVFTYLPMYAAIYHRYRPTVWYLVGGENFAHLQGIFEVVRHGGRVVCYAGSQKKLLEFLADSDQLGNDWNMFEKLSRRFTMERVVAIASASQSIDISLPLIHFPKDPLEFKGWVGDVAAPLYLANSLKERGGCCHEEVFIKTRPKHWYLAGSDNADYGTNARTFPYHELKHLMRHCRLFCNLGTAPAPYTLGAVEASLTGMPIVTPLYKHDPLFPQYMVHEMWAGGCYIFQGDIDTWKEQLIQLLADDSKCSALSEKARERALSLFDWNLVAKKWSELFDEGM